MIVITGAAGFIGSNIVWQLNGRGREDLIVVDVAPGDQGNANLQPLRYAQYLEKDAFLTWIQDVNNAAEVETVYHMGACSSTTETDADYLNRNNFYYTRDLCRACLKADVRFINASSAATYGDGDQGYSDDHDGLRNLRPLNLYAKSKQDFDLWALDEGVLDEIVCLKYFNVYGPNEWHKDDMRSMVCKGFEQIQETGLVRLFKSDRPEFPDGGQQRDFVYVKDAVAMTLWFADNKDKNGIFNCGTGQANDWNRLLGAVFDALGKDRNIDYVPMPDHLQGKYQYHTQAEMGKLQEAGYDQPLTELEHAVADYVQNHLVPRRHLQS